MTKKQYTLVQGLVDSLDDLADLIASRLVENLRRKNEALKQAAKRERSDSMAAMVPSVSPTCLNDDYVPLRLLVKLGKTQEAATAYSARRSLLLLERYEINYTVFGSKFLSQLQLLTFFLPLKSARATTFRYR